MNKSEIRKKILNIRKRYNIKDFKINFKYLLNFLKKKNFYGKTIGGYYPYNYELNVLDILKKFEKKKYSILLPRIKENSQMDFYCWSTKEPLIINNYGIPEPTSNQIKYPDILLVPLVAYDKNFNRIGYGGGFYDRYIKKIKKRKKIITIGLAFSFQKVKKIPTKKHDMKLDFIMTDKLN